MTIGSATTSPSPQYSVAVLKKASEAEAQVAAALIQSAVRTAPAPAGGLSIIA